MRALRILREGREEAPWLVEWESVPANHQVVRSELAEVLREQGIEVDSTYEARHFLLGMLNAGLEPFHPRLVDGDLASQRPDLVFLNVALYSVCCLELYNHIFEQAVYRRCGNDNCRRLFVRQTGRSELGQYRSEGLKYCSKHCARAQAQRQFRARQRASSRSSKGSAA
jgi:hypothetical protein